MRVFLKIRKKLCIGHFFDHFDTPLFTQCTFGNYKKFSDNILKLQKNSSKPVCVSILTSATMIYFSEKLFLCVPLAQLVVIHWLASSHLVITQCRRRRPFQNTKCPWIRWKIQIPVSIFVLKISRYLIDFFGFYSAYLSSGWKCWRCQRYFQAEIKSCFGLHANQTLAVPFFGCQ